MELHNRKTMTTVRRSIATFRSLLCLLVILKKSIGLTITKKLSTLVYFFLPKVSSGGLNDGLVHPGVHNADQSKGQQHHDEEVGNQYIVPTVVHSLSHLSWTNLT